MIEAAYTLSMLLLSLSFFAGLYRLIRGPNLLNRLLAFDLIALCIIAITVVYSLIYGVTYFVEIMIIFCLLGFTTTIAFMDLLFRAIVKKEELNE